MTRNEKLAALRGSLTILHILEETENVIVSRNIHERIYKEYLELLPPVEYLNRTITETALIDYVTNIIHGTK